MVVGDIVLIKKINNTQSMVIESIINDIIRCRYFDDDHKLYDIYCRENELILGKEYLKWNKQQIRINKLNRIIDEDGLS